MIILLSGHGLRQDATDPGAQARGRRYPPGAVRFRSKPVRRSGDVGSGMRAERTSAVSNPANRRKPAMDQLRGGPAEAVMLIVCVGLAIEAILPWAVLWLSDVFVFDTPPWSRWLVFGAPPVLSMLALGLYLALGPGSRRLCPASITAMCCR